MRNVAAYGRLFLLLLCLTEQLGVVYPFSTHHATIVARPTTTRQSIIFLAATTPEPVYLSDNHIATLRKEASKRLANKRMPVLFLTENETHGDFADSSLHEIAQAMSTAELVQVRGLSRDAKKQIRNVADSLAAALSVEMAKDVNLVECKGHAAIYYCPANDDDDDLPDGSSKIKLFTSVGKKNQWTRKPKPVRDNRGQIIPGLYE